MPTGTPKTPTIVIHPEKHEAFTTLMHIEDALELFLASKPADILDTGQNILIYQALNKISQVLSELGGDDETE